MSAWKKKPGVDVAGGARRPPTALVLCSLFTSLLSRQWVRRDAAAPGLLPSQLVLAFFPVTIALLYFCNY